MIMSVIDIIIFTLVCLITKDVLFLLKFALHGALILSN